MNASAILKAGASIALPGIGGPLASLGIDAMFKLPFPNPLPWPFPQLPIPKLPFDLLSDLMCGTRGTQVVDQPSRTPSAGQTLTTDGKSTIDTGRYLVECKENEVRIFDKQTNTWVKAWGDPHLVTSDGDKGQFHENLTIDLQDGTKVTIKTTPKDANGVAWVDAVAVMKGENAVVATGFHDGKAGVNMGNVLRNADSVDRMWADGTVLRAGHQVDDLTFARDGREILGTDPKARWGEHNLDGKGGVSRYQHNFGDGSVRPARPGGTNGAGAANGANGAGGATGANGAGGAQAVGPESAVGGGSIFDILWRIIEKLSKQVDEKVKGLEGKTANGIGEETALKKDFADVQRLMDLVNQLTNTLTNLQKSDHDAKMSIIRNFQ